MLRCYTDLIQLPTFKERYEYLRLGGVVGQDTFGFDRYLNQKFYHSHEWKQIRNKVIIRDEGRDLAMEGYELHNNIFIPPCPIRYSIFCICSLTFSISVLSSMPQLEISRSLDFDRMVLASRFISCAMKSSFLPMLPPSIRAFFVVST